MFRAITNQAFFIVVIKALILLSIEATYYKFLLINLSDL
jgi:hypothetical protein